MNAFINYTNNPLHGVGLKKLLIEIVDHYGFDILYAYLNINCFKSNPSIDSSVKFLKKTDWAREKVESFYLYEFKNLPRVSADQFELSPRDRIVPEDQTPGEPAKLSLEDAERLREKRTIKAKTRTPNTKGSSRLHKDPGSRRGDGHPNDQDSDSKTPNSPGAFVRSSSNPWTKQKDDSESSNAPNRSVKSDSDPWAKWKK